MLQVIRGFRRNQGMLLAGAVAYYMLLSIVPLLVLVLVGLSHVFDESQLLPIVTRHLQLVMPAAAETLTGHIQGFLEHKQIIGTVGMLVMLFFSTMAFTVLENTMSIVFFHRVAIERRHFLVSALIPFAFILLIGFGMLLITIISGALQALGQEQVALFGHVWRLGGISGLALYLLGLGGLILLLTALYLVMPVGRIAPRHALLGGAVAGLLWEITRHLMVWYFTTLSMVNLVYGSLASAVVVLLGFEAAAVILLLGAQVIAEFERCSLDGDWESGGFNTQPSRHVRSDMAGNRARRKHARTLGDR